MLFSICKCFCGLEGPKNSDMKKQALRCRFTKRNLTILDEKVFLNKPEKRKLQHISTFDVSW